MSSSYITEFSRTKFLVQFYTELSVDNYVLDTPSSIHPYNYDF